MYDFLQAKVVECDVEIERVLHDLNDDRSPPETPLPSVRHARGRNEPKFEVRKSLYTLLGADLSQIHGLGPYSVLRLVAECGDDMRKWPTSTLHADRGSSMISKPVAFLLADLGVTKTHSRPHVSDDNPFSEAHFKTLKYRPDFPERFGSIQHARSHGQDFFPWYNTEHHHAGLGLLTPHVVHHGLAGRQVEARASVLAAAHAIHPERFTAGMPRPPAQPTAVWINPPKALMPTNEENRQ